MNNARRLGLDACTTEALRHLAEATRCVQEDTAFGDEVAKESLAMAALALDRMRRLLERPVFSSEPIASRNTSTAPAGDEVAA